MMPFPMFIPMSMAVESPDLAARVRQLESALALSLELLHTLLERLEDKLGPGFLGEELGRLTAAGGVTAKEEAARIDALLREGHKPTAVRHLRELAGLTWDQAHDIMKRWGSYPPEQKVHWLQIAQWVKALGALSPGLTPPDVSAGYHHDQAGG